MIEVIPVACLSDNYAYLVKGSTTGQAFVVDPSEAGPVEAALQEHQLSLAAILITHHHFDHVGGLGGLAGKRPDLPVYGSLLDEKRVEGLTHLLADRQSCSLLGLTIEALHVPGHTLGAVAYLVTCEGDPPVVFTGDTLFVAGCGRMFEGTPEGMRRSLVDVLAALPDACRVYCGHEYTEDNLRFAKTVEPRNEAIDAAMARAKGLRADGLPTVPSTVASEREVNPFLRDHIPAVRAFAGLSETAAPHEVFAALRSAKNSFR